MSRKQLKVLYDVHYKQQKKSSMFVHLMTFHNMHINDIYIYYKNIFVKDVEGCGVGCVEEVRKAYKNKMIYILQKHFH